MDPLLLGWLNGIKRRVRSFRVADYAATADELRVVVGPIPIAAPFPNVAADVVKSVGVRRELRDGRNAGEAILAGVFDGELTLERIRHRFAAGMKLISPG